MDQTRPKNLSPAIRASFENGTRLLEDAQYLLEYGCFPTAYALSILAQEEFAKTFLLFLVQDGAVPWNSNVHHALRDHTCKQLVGTIMDYLDAEWEKYLETLKITGKVEFPSHIADALNILSHEKMPKGSKEYVTPWRGNDEYSCDKQARAVADGKIDKQKQRAFYVGVGKTGLVNSTPLKVTKNDATIEYEKTKRLKGIFNRFGKNIEIFKTCEFVKVSDSFRLLFGSITIEEYEKRW